MNKNVIAILLLAVVCALTIYTGNQWADFALGGLIAMVVVVASVVPAVWLALLPSLIAWGCEDKNTRSIVLINLLLGWTIIGWFVALIWACQGLLRRHDGVAIDPSVLGRQTPA